MLDATTLHPSEITHLRKLARPGDRVAVYHHPIKGGWFRFVGPASPSQVAPDRVQGRPFVGFANLTTGRVESAQAVAA